MKNPDRLPHVLHALLDLPALPRLLNSPPALVNYLRQAWPEQDPEAETLWGTPPDSQEAAEEAEILPQVEAQLDRLELTPQQQTALLRAISAVCPECQESASLLLSSVPA